MDVIDRLLEHDRWSMHQLLDACRDLTDEQLDREFDIGHRTLRETWDHVIFNVMFWTGLMLGDPPPNDRRERTWERTIPAFTDRYTQAQSTLASAINGFRDKGQLSATYLDHWQEPTTNVGTLIHLAIHNAEHRSEILHILQRLGLTDLPEVDYAYWEHVTGSA
jgi:uncharacterized damage-inducible protein DinB